MKKFSYNKENLENALKIIKRYPANKQKSALIPLLDLAQRQNNGWLSVAAIEYIADFLAVPYIKVYELVTFYSMFNLKPIGKYHMQICRTTPCWLKGAEKIIKKCEEKAKTKCNYTSDNGLFTISQVECLGACVNAPIVQINDNYIENVTTEKISKIIEDIESNKILQILKIEEENHNKDTINSNIN